VGGREKWNGAGRRCKERDRETEMDRERGRGGREEGGGWHLDLADDDTPQADEVYEERRSDFLSTDTDDTDDTDDAGAAPHQPPAQSGDAAAGTDGVGQVIRTAERAAEVHSTERGGFAGHYHTVPSACPPKLRILIHTAIDIAR
jgi:hypothetical protein